jgi:hypothetical protein
MKTKSGEYVQYTVAAANKRMAVYTAFKDLVNVSKALKEAHDLNTQNGKAFQLSLLGYKQFSFPPPKAGKGESFSFGIDYHPEAVPDEKPPKSGVRLWTNLKDASPVLNLLHSRGYVSARIESVRTTGTKPHGTVIAVSDDWSNLKADLAVYQVFAQIILAFEQYKTDIEILKAAD